MNAYQQAFRLLPVLLLLSWPSLLQAQCAAPIAIVSAFEGKLDVRRGNEAEWHQATDHESLCAGDTVRVGTNSRGTLTLADHTLVRLGASTTATLTGPQENVSFLVKLLEGLAHIMSRVPRSLEVDTPFVNAGVEGTEFLVRVDEAQAFVSVFEGTVVMKNDTGRLQLVTGQSASAGPGAAPQLQVVARPRDAVQWTLYYPPLVASTDYAARAADGSPLARAIALHSEGRTGDALMVLDQATVVDTDMLTYRASLRLAVGRADDALEDIEQSLERSPDNGDALALKSIIAVVQGESGQALQAAEAAVRAAPEAAPPRLALSYALQARFQLEAALDVLEDTAFIAPDNALVWARLAELHLMFRNMGQALKASQRAIALAPDNAQAHSVLGFARLIAMDTKGASRAFRTAIEQDPSAPMPQLGLGLALIRQGELSQGRRAMEIAAILDPGNSLVRSYLGKAYYEEKRDNLADEQYTMAMELDPRDPTPFFYNAILKQVDNRPVEALENLQQAIDKNDNRAVYRSRLLLDEDLATRGASVAGIYNTLGFNRLAAIEADRSLNLDPGNYSAHRFLADSYSNLPRHEIARASELLKSQLLQPLNHTPLQPHVAENDLFILERIGAADAAYNEYHPLFEHDATFQASFLAGNHGTLSNEVILAGTGERYSYSLGKYHYQSDGFRENNDLQHEIYNLFGQLALSPRFSMQAEYRSRETESGDLSMRFDPEFFDPQLRKEYERQTGRLGFHYQPAPGRYVLGSAIYQELDELRRTAVIEDLSPFAGLVPFDPVGTSFVTENKEKTTGDARQAELQYLHTGARFAATFGLGYLEHEYDVESRTLETLVIPDDRFVPVPPFPEPNVPAVTASPTVELDGRYRNAYVYLNINAWKDLVWTLGASHDAFEYIAGDSEETNPKLGVTWQPAPGTQLRAAWFKTTTRPYASNQTIEPTQVAGFNQFFDETAGSLSERYGVAVDQRLNAAITTGVSATRRESEQPRFGVITTSNVLEEEAYEAYLFWLLNRRLAMSTRLILENVDQSQSSPTNLDTLRVPLELRYFGPTGFYAIALATYVDQRIESGAIEKDDDQFWNVDTTLGYTLPRRYGVIRLSVNNLFNTDFHYQDSNFKSPEPMTSMYLPERVVLCELRLNAF